MNKVSNIKHRIKEFAENTGENKDLFFEKLGMSSANFRGKKLETKVNADVIDKIVSLYPSIDLHWLITGEKNSAKENYVNEEAAEYGLTTQGVPFYDIEFAAGFEDFTQNQQLQPTSIINHPFFNGCDYVIRASGQSMSKIIKHGDLIGISKIENWQEFLPVGEVYALVTKDNFRMIKVVTKGDTKDHFTLISKPSESKKDEFPPQQIKKSHIICVFKVQASSYLF